MTYISKTTQNLLLNCHYNIITETMTGRTKKQLFLILCNEASDPSNKEQLPFSLGYVNDKENVCNEFSKFIHCKSDLTGKDLYNEVTEALSSFGLDLRNFHGQSYDIADVVSGHLDGISALFLKESSFPVCAHCTSHSLNLVIGTSCKISTAQN